MLFYKVKKEIGGLVLNELYTEKECKRLEINKKYCDPVTVSKQKTHWFFGARLADSDKDIVYI